MTIIEHKTQSKYVPFLTTLQKLSTTLHSKKPRKLWGNGLSIQGRSSWKIEDSIELQNHHRRDLEVIYLKDEFNTLLWSRPSKYFNRITLYQEVLNSETCSLQSLRNKQRREPVETPKILTRVKNGNVPLKNTITQNKISHRRARENSVFFGFPKHWLEKSSPKLPKDTCNLRITYIEAHHCL